MEKIFPKILAPFIFLCFLSQKNFLDMSASQHPSRASTDCLLASMLTCTLFLLVRIHPKIEFFYPMAKIEENFCILVKKCDEGTPKFVRRPKKMRVFIYIFSFWIIFRPLIPLKKFFGGLISPIIWTPLYGDVWAEKLIKNGHFHQNSRFCLNK